MPGADTIKPSSKPHTLAVQPDAIPDEIKAIERWVAWRWEHRDGKWTKPPRDARRGTYAASTKPETWATFDETLAMCRRGEADGIGLGLVAGDDLLAVDLDHVVNPQTAEIEPWAAEIVAALDSYAEVSPSGTGLRVLLRGALPDGERKRGNVETY